MSEHRATVDWKLNGPDFRRGKYSREHHWEFDGGVRVLASASPSVVRAPWSNPEGIDPEEAYVASIASCHMLWWLSLAAAAGIEVESYRDEAVGFMEKNEAGQMWVSTVTLNPRITYGASPPSPELEARLHHEAHHECFIANSVKTRIIVSGIDG